MALDKSARAARRAARCRTSSARVPAPATECRVWDEPSREVGDPHQGANTHDAPKSGPRCDQVYEQGYWRRDSQDPPRRPVGLEGSEVARGADCGRK